MADLGERGILREIIRPRYQGVPGFGDDCALVVDDLVMTTDSCGPPMMDQLGKPDKYNAGWLLATMNLSDLAAAGAYPLGLVVNYTLPGDTPVRDLRRLMKGVDDCAREHGTRVLGGDLRDSPEQHLSATAIGRTISSPDYANGGRLSRRGSQAGDEMLLIGHPGYLWAAAVIHTKRLPVSEDDRRRVFERARRPMAQLRAGQLLAEAGLATAAVDVSDGLYASVRLLAEANGIGAELGGTIDLDDVLRNVCDLAGIDDFQLGQTWGDWCLLVTVRPERADEAKRFLLDHDVSVRGIGRMTATHTELRVRGDVEPWCGVDQERFSERSWHGAGIGAQIERMVRQSR